jgi:hypothetical protein
MDVMCRASSSGTPAVTISASWSSKIGAADGVMVSSENPVRAPRVRVGVQVHQAPAEMVGRLPAARPSTPGSSRIRLAIMVGLAREYQKQRSALQRRQAVPTR